MIIVPVPEETTSSASTPNVLNGLQDLPSASDSEVIFVPLLDNVTTSLPMEVDSLPLSGRFSKRLLGVIEKKIDPYVSVVPLDRRLVYTSPRNNFFTRWFRRFFRFASAQTIVTKSIGTAAGRDYSNITNWESTQGGDLVAGNTIQKGELYNDSTFKEAAVVTIDATTDDSTHYMWLTVAAGERHDGTVSTGVIVQGSGAGDVFEVLDSYGIIEWLTIQNWGSGSSVKYGIRLSTNGGVSIRYNILQAATSSAAHATASGVIVTRDNHFIHNNIVMNTNGATGGKGMSNTSNADGVLWYNNTVFNASSAFNFENSATDGLVINNIAASSTNSYIGTFHASSDYNLSTNSNATGGANDIVSADINLLFVSYQDVSNPDLHIKSLSPAVNKGTNLGDSYKTDIDGETRSGTWDIGADELLVDGAAWSRCRVEQATTSMTGQTTTTVITLTTPITSTTQAFLMTRSTLTSGATTTDRYTATGYIASTTALVFERYSTSSVMFRIAYSLVECFDGEFSVQRGVATIPVSSLTATTSVNSVSMSRSMVLVAPKVVTALSYNMYTDLVTGELQNSKTVLFERSSAASSSAVEVRYEVITFSVGSGAKVQTGEVTASFGSSATSTQTINNVSTTRAWLYCTWDADKQDHRPMSVGCNLPSSTAVEFSLHGTYSNATNRIRYYVVEFPVDTVTVQRGTSPDAPDLSDGSLYTHTITLPTPIRSPLKAFSFVTHTMNSGVAPPRHRWNYLVKTTSTIHTEFLRPDGGSTNADNLKYWQLIEFPTPQVSQVSYKWFQNTNSTGVGLWYATSNAVIAAPPSDPFRLRLLLHATSTAMPTSSQMFFKLQFAERSGTCDSGFSGETYQDITSTSSIMFYNNATPGDGTALTATTTGEDPGHGNDIVRNQTYEEANDFTNSSTRISVGEDGMWDFSLELNNATSGAMYCIRAVWQDGTLLSSYDSIPQVLATSNTAWTRCRVETATSSIVAGTTSTTITPQTLITSTTQAFLLTNFTSDGNGSSTDDHAVSGQIDSTSSLLFVRESTGNVAYFSYSLVECFDNEFAAQRGEVTMTTALADYVVTTTINAVDTSRSAVFLSFRSLKNDSDERPLLAMGSLTDSTTLRIERASSSGTTYVRYEVVEFASSSGVLIQTATATIAAAVTSTQVSFSSPVGLERTWLYCMWDASDNALINSSVGCHASTSAILFLDHYRNAALFANVVRYYLIQFPPNTVKTQHQAVANNNPTTANGVESNHDVTLATLIRTPLKAIPYLTNSVQGTGTAFTRNRWISFFLSTSTLRARFYRGDGSGSGTSSDQNYKYWQAVEFPSPATSQYVYRWFNNTDSTGVGTALAATNTSTTAPNQGTPFRLRMHLYFTERDLPTQSQSMFKLQYATTSASGQCDSAFSGETYQDVSSSAGTIRFYDNSSATDGATLTASSGDPIGDHSVANEQYRETNPFSNTASVASGTDGRWDFSLVDNSATQGQVYCFRAVHLDGTLLSSYSYIPEITASGQAITCSITPTSVSFSSLTTAAVQAASPNVTTTVTCGSSNGCSISLTSTGNGSEAGLASSTSPAQLIESGSSPTSTLVAGTDGFGAQMTTTTAGSGGVFTVLSRYFVTGDVVGNVSTTAIVVASSSASITNRELVTTLKSAVGYTTRAGGGYADTLTYSCVAN